MKRSFADRLFWTILAVGLANVLVTSLLIEYIYEDVEELGLRSELVRERDYFLAAIDGDRREVWETALLSAVFVPDGESLGELPSAFEGLPVPFAGEVDRGEYTHLVLTERLEQPPGRLLIAQDITELELREDQIERWVLGGLIGVMGLLSLIMARLGAARVVRPLRRLSTRISRVSPQPPIERLSQRYRERELVDIAASLNGLLDALDSYVRREKALVSLASHELRTPLAVISGALDVLESRRSLGEADQRTVARIRQAALGMSKDVESLLMLARGEGLEADYQLLDVPDWVERVFAELSAGEPSVGARLRLQVQGEPWRVEAPPPLLHMLLRNVIHNALRHTGGAVRVLVEPGCLSIIDEGEGLPAAVRGRLARGEEVDPGRGGGLGLFIVQLICERLGWTLAVPRSDEAGTVLSLGMRVYDEEGAR